ncbi:hypothetical protein G7Y89_g15822 [Cudoniella acicularis]|uniref:Uncharacterized protein n=1 Tax=Cudoniella acicularis TaxID=354080 RepID=A0A8H4QFP0_9HELO|nr:hypothetical protein G7Y89_g15822 [Cudoniella acicularis]
MFEVIYRIRYSIRFVVLRQRASLTIQARRALNQSTSRLNSTPIRRTPPRRTQSRIGNYLNFEHIDEPIVNPLRSLATPSRQSRLQNVQNSPTTPTHSQRESQQSCMPVTSQPSQNNENNDEDNDSEASVANQPMHAIPTTVTLRVAQEQGIRIKKASIESTWTRHHFNIEYVDVVYKKHWLKEAVFGKSGEAMAEVLFTSFDDDINFVTQELIDGKLFEKRELSVCLKIAHKIFAVYGDNASNSDTFFNHFLKKL